jgi:peptidoglycan/LPS O-acetylase OafA/YrhL
LNTRRNNDIECLRAIAVLSVAFGHIRGNLFKNPPLHVGAWEHYVDFWFGVDLFFAISGYVIARDLLPRLAAFQGSFRDQWSIVLAFWIRRIWRLLPSAWLWLALVLLAVVGFNHSGAFGSLHANLMATLAGMFDFANVRFGHAIFRYEYGASFVYWSLSLEEQFYLLLPLLAICLRRRIDLCMLALLLVQVWFIRTPMLMALRTDAIAWGVLLAIAEASPRYASANPQWLLKLGPARWLLPCALVVLLAVFAGPFLLYWRFRIAAIAVVSAVLVWLASYDQGYILPRGALKRVLTWVGARSYAIYLIHVPVYFFMREVFYRLDVTMPAHGVGAVAIRLSALALILLFAQLNYRYVEQPLRRYGRKLAGGFLQRRIRGESYPDGVPNVGPAPDHGSVV